MWRSARAWSTACLRYERLAELFAREGYAKHVGRAACFNGSALCSRAREASEGDDDRDY